MTDITMDIVDEPRVIQLIEERPFHLDEYIRAKSKGRQKRSKPGVELNRDKRTRFDEICKSVKSHFEREWDISGKKSGKDYENILERQKRAIIGHPKEVSFFKDRIDEYLKKENLINEWKPSWYRTLTDAIFHENWGLPGIAPWSEGESLALRNSSSAKIVGDRIYFMIDGKQELQEQRISTDRFNQLVKALLLKTPKTRLDRDYYEVFMLDGTRITIYGEGKSKEGQASMIFRKFLVKDYTFDKQVQYGTIPDYSIPIFKAMIAVGFNVAFTGPVRTAKTTFLTTWQTYENPVLEGVSVETDPEIPFHTIMPEAPIVQLVADGAELEMLVKSILRSDADYVIMAEARDSTAFYIALEVTDRGTRRSKMTAHFSNATEFPYNMANKIVEKYGGDLYSTTLKVAQNINYVFEFIQLKDKSKKRLKGIYELRKDAKTHEVTIHQICKYNFLTDDWGWRFDIGDDKRIIGEEEDYEAFLKFEEYLKRAATEHPMVREGENDEDYIFRPSYNGGRKSKKKVSQHIQER